MQQFTSRDTLIAMVLSIDEGPSREARQNMQLWPIKKKHQNRKILILIIHLLPMAKI